MSTVRRLTRLTAAAVAVVMAMFVSDLAYGDNSGGSRICDGRYALCSSAECKPIDGDPTHVKCACEGPLNGLNIADSSCQARTNILTSTFSLWDITATSQKPAKTVMNCTGENANKWAFCLDAPCKQEGSGVSCTCQLNARSDYVIFTSACATNDKALRAACAKTWSSASQPELMSGYSQLAPFYGNPPKLAYCPAIGSPSGAAKP
jgi:hypothetical protein